MGVFISDDELNTFKQNGISELDLQDTISQYRNEGVSDDDIRLKINNKLSSFSTTQQTEQKPLANTALVDKDAEVARIKAEFEAKNKEIDRQHRKAMERIGLGAALQGISALPVFNIPYVGTGIGGALFDAGGAIMEGKSGKDIAKKAGEGFIIGETVGALPYVGKYAGKTKAGQAALKGVSNATQKLLEAPVIKKAIEATTPIATKIGDELVKPRSFGKPNVETAVKAEIVNPTQFENIVDNGITTTTMKQNGNDVGYLNSYPYNEDAIFIDYIKNTTKGTPEEIKGVGTQLVDDLLAKNPEKNIIWDAVDKNADDFKHIYLERHPEAKDRVFGEGEYKFLVEQAKENGYNNVEEFLNVIKQKRNSSTSNRINNTENKSGFEYTRSNKGSDAGTSRMGGEFKQSRLASASGLPEELQGLNPEYQVLHNKDLINSAAQDIENLGVNEVASSLRNIEEPSALDFEKARQTVDRLFAENRTAEAMELIESIAEKGSKAGQAVQAMSLWSKTTPAGAVKTAQNIISKYNKTAKNKIEDLTEQQANDIIELTNNIHKSAEGREKDVATAQLMKYFSDLVPPSTRDKLRTLRNISLLLNPKTFTRNITGNTIFAGMENLAAKPIAAGIDTLASLFTKEKTRTLPNVSEYTKGLLQGAKEGVEDVRLGIDTRKGIGGRFDLPQRRSFEQKPILGKFEQALDYSLIVPDRAFYQESFNESLANQMKATGVQEPTQEMLKIANDEALESVYQNKGKLGNLAIGTRNALNNIGLKQFGLGDALVPYAQTPANVAQQSINYSPLGFVKSAANFIDNNQRQATLDAARALVGSGLMYGGYQGVKNGIINKDIEDYEALQNYQALGIRPNTINLPNGYNMSFNQLQPLAASIAAGAALGDIKNGDYMGALNASLGSIADMSMLRGVTDFVNDYNKEGLGSAVVNTALGLPSQFIPTGLNQINSYIDPIQRETYDPNPLKRMANKIGARIPVVSKLLPEKYDVVGQPIQKYQTEGAQRAFDTFINPVFVNKETNDATLKELTRMYEQTGDKAQLLPVADRTVKFKDIDGKQVTKKLSGEEVSRYQQQLGTVNKRVLDQFIQSDFYNMLDDEQKVNEIAKIERQVKQKVDEELFNKPNPQIRNIIRKFAPTTEDKIVKEILGIYNKQILPVQINSTYENNFGNE